MLTIINEYQLWKRCIVVSLNGDNCFPVTVRMYTANNWEVEIKFSSLYYRLFIISNYNMMKCKLGGCGDVFL